MFRGQKEMVTILPDLEKKLLEQVKIQNETDFDEEEIDIIRVKNIRLLRTFRDGIIGEDNEIDVFFILKKGLMGKSVIYEALGNGVNIAYLNPHYLSLSDKKFKVTDPSVPEEDILQIKREFIDKNHIGLMVEDYWCGGITFEKSLLYLANAGYKRDNMFALYCRGSFGFKDYEAGFVHDNPVLATSSILYQFFQKKLEDLNKK